VLIEEILPLLTMSAGSYPPEANIEHYDGVSSAFLSMAGTMLAIIVGLFPFSAAQSVFNSTNEVEMEIAVALLAITILLDVLSLLDRQQYVRKRLLARVSAIPLLVSVLVLASVVFR